jgi:trehalose 6-phosphate synthase/phosphatase
MLVTPLRDGMNLVAKEYVASRIDGDGVLVLSEFAGAAHELPEALIVNPYDVEAIATALERALEMPEHERRTRMGALRAKVASRPVELWAESFVAALGDTVSAQAPRRLHDDEAELGSLARELAALPEVFLALDYDGTLVPIYETPEAARPDAELNALLDDLAALPSVRVAIVSGRSKESLTEFVGEKPIALVAEHGAWVRLPGGDWQYQVDPASISWREPVLEMLRDYTARTPGSRIEEKTAGIAWHYRRVERQLGAARAREVRLNLVQALAQQPVTVLAGRKVVEVRPQGVDKGRATRVLFEQSRPGAGVVAIGDDRTDEDMFRALPPDAYTFAAGPAPTRARFRLNGPTQVRSLLREFEKACLSATGRASAPAVNADSPPDA